MSALRILVPVKRVIDYAVTKPDRQLRSSGTLTIFTGQAPSQQGPNGRRNSWCQALNEPVR